MSDFFFEHTAINVPDATGMAKWYQENINMQIVRKAQNQTHFLADASGRTVLEIYTNPAAPVPDYTRQAPLVLHIAFQVDNVKECTEKLVNAGAGIVEPVNTTESGDEMAMLRDPWGIALQILKRAEPMLSLT
jgi:glyoxylase I family protein